MHQWGIGIAEHFFNAIDPSSAKAIGHVMPMVESCQHSDQVNFSLSTWFGDGHQFSGHNVKSLYEHTEVHPLQRWLVVLLGSK